MHRFEQYPELKNKFNRCLELYLDNFKNSHTLSPFLTTKHVSTTTIGEFVNGKCVQTPLKSHQTVFMVWPEVTKKVNFVQARTDFYREARQYGQAINQEIMLAIKMVGDEFDANKPGLDQYFKSIRKKISLGYDMEEINSLKFSPALSRKLEEELKDPANRARYMKEMEKILRGE